ncbi:unnamed protein product [Camellia sinensis]
MLPQLRSVTSMELGCDARAGRSSPELNKMHAWIQGALSIVDKDQLSLLAAVALKEKRLAFTWLDGEAQQGYQKTSSQLPYALYSRAKIVLKLRKKKPKNMLEAFLNDEVDPASELVAMYNGSEESSGIIRWISQIIEDGDSRELPFLERILLHLFPKMQILFSFGIGSIMNGINDRLGDSRIGPVLLLGALMSFGSIWLQRSQSTHPSQSNNQTQPSKKTMMKIDQIRDTRRERCQTKIVLLP